MGACATSWAVWVDAMSATYSGKAMTATPSRRIRWERMSRKGRRSIMLCLPGRSVIDLAVYVAKLRDRERHDDKHQDHGLRGGGTDIQPLETGRVHLVHKDGCRSSRTTLGHDVDDGKG